MGGWWRRGLSRALGAVAGLAVVILTTAAPAVGQEAPPAYPGLANDNLLPGLPGPPGPQPGPVPRCRRATLECVRETIALMRELRRTLGCDHRAVFATTYLLLTREIAEVLRERPRFFSDRDWLIYQDVVFANFYFRVLSDDAAGLRVPEAWRIAFDTAARRDANAGQDMLLGINAHVQRDMPYVLAKVGIRTRSGASRKPDHDRVNQVLRRAYEPIVRKIGARYDPLITTTNSGYTPADDIGGLELVRSWREGVWRNAERLVGASSATQRRAVKDQIEANAAAWARSIAAEETPGYRAQRDAYCRERLSFAGSAPSPPFAIELAAQPRRLQAGRRERVRFTAMTSATGFSRAPVPGATVRFAGERSVTDRRGHASIAVRLDRQGRKVAKAHKPGLRSGRDAITVVSGYPDGAGRAGRHGFRRSG